MSCAVNYCLLLREIHICWRIRSVSTLRHQQMEAQLWRSLSLFIYFFGFFFFNLLPWNMRMSSTVSKQAAFICICVVFFFFWQRWASARLQRKTIGRCLPNRFSFILQTLQLLVLSVRTGPRQRLPAQAQVSLEGHRGSTGALLRAVLTAVLNPTIVF